MKRLLAYSSIENMGLIVMGMGLAIVFAAYKMPSLAALALTAMLYHCLNHAIFKSLLFLGTGSVLHATQERSLGKLGGLMRFMPWVAWTTLVGVIASAGLPPSNGFASEWLLLQGFLFTGGLPNPYLKMLVPMFAAGLVLVAALAGYVMVKFFGVIFLGQPREATLRTAHDAGIAERIGLAWLALGCILLGLFPTQVISSLSRVIQPLGFTGLALDQRSWWVLVPLPQRQASYAPLTFFVVILVVVLLTIAAVRFFYHQRIRLTTQWD